MGSPARQHPQLLESVFEASNDGVFVYRMIRDHRGVPARFRRTLTNAQGLRMLAQPEAKVLERAMPDLPTHDLFDDYVGVATMGRSLCFNKVIEDGSGDIAFAYQVEASAVDDGLLIRLSDVTVRLREARSTRQQTDRLKKLARRSRDLLVFATPEGQIVSLLGAASDVLGEDPPHWIGKTLMQLVHRDERHLLLEAGVLRSAGSLRVRREGTPADPTRWFEIELEADGQGRLVVLRDITVLRSLEDRVAELAPDGAAKGMASRAVFLQRFEQEMARRRRYGRLTTVAVVALDQQKAISTTHGPDGLKRARQAVSEAAVGMLRTVDLVAHWSDDAMVFLLPETPVKGGVRACERLAEKLHDQVVEHDGQVLPITVSAGLTGLDADDDVRSVLGRASRAINRGRRDGPGQIIVANAIDDDPRG